MKTTGSNRHHRVFFTNIMLNSNIVIQRVFYHVDSMTLIVNYDKIKDWHFFVSIVKSTPNNLFNAIIAAFPKDNKQQRAYIQKSIANEKYEYAITCRKLYSENLNKVAIRSILSLTRKIKNNYRPLQ